MSAGLGNAQIDNPCSGIEIGERVPIPDELVPPDARVEIDAKIHAGYHTDKAMPTESDLTVAKGRSLND